MTWEEALKEHELKLQKQEEKVAQVGHIIGQIIKFIYLVCRKLICNW